MNKINVGDSREELSCLDDKSVDLVVTSPPYNVSVDYSEYDDDLEETEYFDFIEDVFSECYRVLDDDGRIAVNCSQIVGRPMYSLPMKISNLLEDIGFMKRAEFVWDKCDSENVSAWGSWRSPSNPRQIIQHEYILVFSKEKWGKEEYKKSLSKEDFMKYVKSVWNVKPVSLDSHPAAFPKEIPKRLIKLYTYEGDVVLDPFMGSGTTCVVADELDRGYIGFDVDEEYVRVAKERLDSG